MASEIKVTASIQVTNGSFIVPKIGGAIQSITQSSPGGGIPGFVVLTTADTVISLTGVTTLGWIYLKNCDLTNYVTYGPTVAGAIAPFGKLKPGESVVLRLKPAIVLRMQADTATCKVQVLIFED